jgi:hypothetical protein
MTSVLQEWVASLPLREQGVLLTTVRGCDVAPKQLDPAAIAANVERHLVSYLRWCFLNPADPREVDAEPGCWFRSEPPRQWRPSQLMHYPLHWYAHLMHGFQVIKVRHPDPNVRVDAKIIYERLAHALHLDPEPDDIMTERLSEDRLAKGSVVS